MQPILLLGKNGQVGWELQRALAPLGEIVAPDRSVADLADIAQLRGLVRSLKPGLIVNAAAYTAVDRAEQEADVALCVNGTAPGVLAEEAAAISIPLIHYSTDYVFDGGKAGPYVEEDRTCPLSSYGRSKLAGEQAITASRVQGAIFRTSWVFGETGANFVRTILRLAAERDSLRIVGDQHGAPTAASLIADVTAHLICVFEREGWPHAETFHLACSHPVTWHAFACSIVSRARQLGVTLRATPENIEAIPTSAYPLPATRPSNSRLDCTKLESALSLTLPHWEIYLDRMLKRLVPEGTRR